MTKTSLLDSLLELFLIYKSLDKRLEKIATQSSCVKACDACCHYLLMASIPEAVYALRYAGKMKIEYNFDVISNQINRIFEPDQTTAKWFNDQIPCPFLKDRACSIYPARPLTCRTHWVQTPVSQCSEEGAMIGQINMRQERMVFLLRFMPKISNQMGLVSSGFGPWPILLAIAQIYLEHSNKITNKILLDLNMHDNTGALINWAYLERHIADDEDGPVNNALRASITRVNSGVLYNRFNERVRPIWEDCNE